MLRLALALGVGLLIGIERGWQTRDAPEGSRVAGVRTFTITGLLGGIVALLATGRSRTLDVPGAILLAIALLTVAAMMTAFALVRARQTGRFSATSGVAAALTFALGAHSVIGDVRLTAAIAVTAAVVLTARTSLHAWVRRITPAELQSTLLLLAMTCIALPVIPDRTLTWLPGFNPREIWLIAIALAAASYAGYLGVRAFGERSGALVAAATGALVSSMAVILASARRAATGDGRLSLLLASCTLASAISLARVAVLSLLLAPALTPTVAPALIAAASTSFGLALVLARFDGSASPPPQLRNPFSLASTLLLAGSIGLVVVLGTLAHARFGGGGALLSALVTGAFDVDSMTVAMSKLVQAGAMPDRIAPAVLAGAAMNMAAKTVVGALVGRGRFALWLTATSVLTVLIGAIVLSLLRWVAVA